jgi:hypothetical protein
MKNLGDTLEYRVVTGGEDGNLAWWNIKYEKPFFPIEKPKSSSNQGKISAVQVNLIEEIRPAHMIYLSTIAGFHVIVNGPRQFVVA